MSLLPRSPPARRRSICLGRHLAFALSLALCPAALAAELDPTSGRLAIEGWGISFDGPDSMLPTEQVVLIGADGRRIEPRDTPGIWAPTTEAIEGQGALRFGGSLRSAYIDLSTQSTSFFGRSVEVRLWFRAVGTRPLAYLVWYSGDVAQALEQLSFTSVHQTGLLRLSPSGRATNDGWVELTTGPVDYALAHRLEPLLVVLDDIASIHGQNRPDDTAVAFVDAVEMIDRGPAQTPDAICRITTEASACGDDGVCLHGRCAHHAAVNGMLPVGAAQREAYLQRRRFELETYSGHQGLRRHLPDYLDTLESLDSVPDKAFWPRLRAGWYLLGDGHASAPLGGYSPPPQLGLCLTQGHADLLPGAPNVPLVFSKTSLHPPSAPFRVGDALVRIDGESVNDWRARLVHRLRYNGDRENAEYAESLQLARVAAITGARLEFARCDGPEPCAQQDVQTLVYDAAEAAEGIWQNAPPQWRNNGAPCDGRFLRLSTGPQSYGDGYFESQQIRGATVVMINATPATFVPQHLAWIRGVDRAFGPGPARAIIDQRVGNGGGFEAISHMIRYLDPNGVAPAHFLMPWLGAFEGRTDVLEAMLACGQSFPSSLQFLWCGGSRFETSPLSHPGPGNAATTRVAVLTGRNVSGNDFLTYHLSRRSTPTRIFGPGPTFGAFGIIMSLPQHGLGLTGGGLQATDGAVLASPNAPLDARLSGPGVPPDEIVLQRQSDALRGVDTMMEQAHAWLVE